MSQPKRRTERLIVREVSGESVVYDLDTDTVHALPEQTARLWVAADGTRSLDQLRLLAGLSEQEALAVLGDLEGKSLMESGTSGISRRTVLQAAAVGAGALAIGSVAVPAYAQVVQSVCIDPDPLDGDTLCETLTSFFQDILDGNRLPLEFPETPGECTDGEVGAFDPRCPGFQIFYKETNADNWPAIGNIKTPFQLCRWPATGSTATTNGDPYILMKGTGAQEFPVFYPGSAVNKAPASCTCLNSCGGVKIDLPNTNSFIFGFQIPPLPPGSDPYYIRLSICYPPPPGGFPTPTPLPRVSVNQGTVDAGNGNVNWDAAPLVPFTTIAANACQTICRPITPSKPLIGFWFKNPDTGPKASSVWVDAEVTTTPCPA